MPTGYTAKIADGKDVDFKTFALDCARAFGACIMLRDEPGGGEAIPDEFQPSLTYLEWAERDRAELSRICSMSDEECDRACMDEFNANERRHARRLLEAAELRARYQGMLDEVEAWEPPSPDHQELKRFMREQLANSIDFDCETVIRIKPEPVPKTGAEWRAERIALLERSLERAKASHADELERTRQRNAWVRALRDLLAASGRRGLESEARR